MIREVRFADEFNRAFKRLKKRYRSLPQDLKQLLASLVENPQQGPSSPMVCTARHSSPLNTYTVTGYATVASPPAEPPERVRTCSTEFAA